MNPMSDSPNAVRKRYATRQRSRSSCAGESCLRLEDRSCVDYAGLSLPTSGTGSKVRPKPQPRFALGRLCITASAARVLPAAEVLTAITRHASGDWGLLDVHDWQQNERALREGGRLFSVYQAGNGQRFYVISESTREVTTVLLPEDY